VTWASSLLAPLAESQQRLVDLIAEAFLSEDYEWPMFHYVEWVLDDEGEDAGAVLGSLPREGRWGYGPVDWARGPGAITPTPDTELALTIVGMAHASRLKEHVETFFELIAYLVAERRTARPSPRSFVDATASSEGFKEHWKAARRVDVPKTKLTWRLLEREPPTVFGSRSYNPDTQTWIRTVSRELLVLDGVSSMPDYVARLEQALAIEEPPSLPFTAPAIPITVALDHLNIVWRLVFGKRLFQFDGAQRIATLSQEASSREEFESRLSVLGDLIRSADAALETRPRKKQRKELSSLRAAIATKIAPAAAQRAIAAVETLEAALAARDSGQHSRASHEGLASMRRLGLSYPVSDWAAAWQTSSARVVDAFTVIADELSATLD
jgi:hypothetical protein